MGNEKISGNNITIKREYKINDNVTGKEKTFSPEQVYKPEYSDGSLYWHVPVSYTHLTLPTKA